MIKARISKKEKSSQERLAESINQSKKNIHEQSKNNILENKDFIYRGFYVPTQN